MKRGDPRGIGRPSCSPILLAADPLSLGQAASTLVEALVVALDVLMFASPRAFFRCRVFFVYLPLEIKKQKKLVVAWRVCMISWKKMVLRRKEGGGWREGARPFRQI